MYIKYKTQRDSHYNIQEENNCKKQTHTAIFKTERVAGIQVANECVHLCEA